MKNFNGSNKTKSYFEGWYFKHQVGEEVISFIPGMNIDDKGEKTAFIQVITNDKSYFVDYPYETFFADEKHCTVYVGNSLFTYKGCDINIDTDDLFIQGTIKYSKTTDLKYNIMGPFSLFKNMECNHGIISMKHNIYGELAFDDRDICMDFGTGYIEKDWGTSFPSAYTWLQCNDFFGDCSCSFMLSIAKIPFYGKEFLGVISVLNLDGKEYRIATYNGGKVVLNSENKVIISAGKMRIEAVIKPISGHILKAPQIGKMDRMIKESPSVNIELKVYKSGKLLFCSKGKNAGFEYVN